MTGSIGDHDAADRNAADEQLMADLARVVAERDPVPPHLLEMARESFTWRTIDAELAELVADSLRPEDAALVRTSAATVRLIVFATRDERVEIEVVTDNGQRQLVGELSPAGPGSLTVEHDTGPLTEAIDAEGRFLVPHVPSGLIRLRCERAGKRPLVTAWVQI
jgi:hypothetical protein